MRALGDVSAPVDQFMSVCEQGWSSASAISLFAITSAVHCSDGVCTGHEKEERPWGKKTKIRRKKKWKEEEEQDGIEVKKCPAAGTYADGHPLHQIQFLEAKLILKTDRFTSVMKVSGNLGSW